MKRMSKQNLNIAKFRGFYYIITSVPAVLAILLLNLAIINVNASDSHSDKTLSPSHQASAPSLTPKQEYLLGLSYAQGRQIEKSFSNAASWWTKAARGGDSEAQYNLAILYYEGRGVQQDPILAFKLIEKASLQGDGRAIGLMGYFLCHGIGTTADEEKGESLLKKAVAMGDPSAMSMLGDRMLIPRQKANGLEVDEQKYIARTDSQIQQALDLLTRAADAGIPSACRLLAAYYTLDKSDPENAKTASNWYFRGAWLGDSYCQLQTAIQYLGWHDTCHAYQWILLASEKKDLDCKEVLETCTRELSNAQQNEGRDDADHIQEYINWRKSKIVI